MLILDGLETKGRFGEEVHVFVPWQCSQSRIKMSVALVPRIVIMYEMDSAEVPDGLMICRRIEVRPRCRTRSRYMYQ